MATGSRTADLQWVQDCSVALLVWGDREHNAEAASGVSCTRIENSCPPSSVHPRCCHWKSRVRVEAERLEPTKRGGSQLTRATINQDLDLGQLIYDMRTEAGLSQRELAERMDTTQSVI